jgi:hypothetical protein
MNGSIPIIPRHARAWSRAIYGDRGAGGDHGNSSAVVDLEVTGALSGFHSRKGLSAMATAKMLVDTARYTVVRQNGGSIEIAPKDNPKGTRLFHRQAERYEGESIAAYYRNGFVLSTGFAPGCSPMQDTGLAG